MVWASFSILILIENTPVSISSNQYHCSKLCSLNNVDNHLKLFFGFRLILGIRFTQILTTKDTFIQFLWEAESQSNDD